MCIRSFKLFLLLTLTLTLTLHSDDFFDVKGRIIQESGFKLGFLYFTPLFYLENVGYTSSIYTYDAEDFPDWTGDFGLGLRASGILANRVILQAEELPSYSFYLENEELRSWSNRFGATAYSHFGPFDLKAGFKQDDLRQRPQLEFSRPFQYKNDEWAGEIDFGRRNRLFLTAYVKFIQVAYGEEPYLDSFNLARSLNHAESVFGLRLNKGVFTKTVIYANYERSHYHFKNLPERDTATQNFALGVEFPAVGALQGKFQIGVRRFKPENPLFRNVQRLSGRGDLKATLMERLRLSVFYELSTSFSYWSSDLFFDNRVLGGGVEIFLTSFLKGGATYQDGRMEYRSSLDLESKRNDRVRQQRYFLAVPFFANTSLGFSYNVYRLTSDSLGLDYTRNYWGGFVSHEF